MKTPAAEQGDTRDGQSPFLTTRWTLVLLAGGESAEAGRRWRNSAGITGIRSMRLRGVGA